MWNWCARGGVARGLRGGGAGTVVHAAGADYFVFFILEFVWVFDFGESADPVTQLRS